MLNLAVLLVIYALVSSVIVNLIMFIKFIGRAPHAGPAIGEFLSILFFSGMTVSYRELLIKEGIELTTFDELLHRVNIILQFAGLAGIALLVLGLFTAD